LPTTVELVSSSSGCSEVNGTVTCSLGTLDANKSTTVSLIVKPNKTGDIVNEASAKCNELPDSVTANISTQAVGPQLSITKTASPNPVLVGQNLTYKITITNTGSAPATNLILTDTLPLSVELVSSSSGCSEANGTVTCNLGMLNASASTTVDLIVKPKETGSIINQASVQWDEFPYYIVDTISTQVVSPQGFISVMIKRDWRNNPPIFR